MPEGSARVRLQVPGLYNVYNALAAASLARGLGFSLEETAEGLGRASAAFGRFERIAIGGRSLVVLLVKNPAGANETLRTLMQGDGPSVAVVALNDGIADGRDVSWIWDVDFEPLAARLERLVASGDRAAELALRFSYGGLDESRIEIVPEHRGCARPRPGADRARRRARLPPYLHGDARPPARHRRPRLRAAVLGARGVRIVIAHLYPDYLNIYADRGNLAVLAGRAQRRGIEADVREVGLGDATPADADLFYIGGGQDREQALIAPDLAARGAALVRCRRRRRGRARRLRRLSAPRALTIATARERATRGRRPPAPHDRGRPVA